MRSRGRFEMVGWAVGDRDEHTGVGAALLVGHPVYAERHEGEEHDDEPGFHSSGQPFRMDGMWKVTSPGRAGSAKKRRSSSGEGSWVPCLVRTRRCLISSRLKRMSFCLTQRPKMTA